MKNRLPNLELLEYQAKLMIKQDKEMMKQLKNKRIELDAYVFPQVWGSTCTAFDVDEKGQATIGGSAMTEAYTTVFAERVTETYFVFVDNRICYCVSNASEKFKKDLAKGQLESLSRAKMYY